MSLSYLTTSPYLSVPEYPPNDPRKLDDLNRRQELCDEVLRARQYTVMNSHANKTTGPSVSERIVTSESNNFQRLKSGSREALPFDQKIAYFKNKGNWEKQTLRLIQCVAKRNQNWYVGFDQNDQRSYLIERFDYAYNTVLFKWIAIIEEGGTPDFEFFGPGGRKKMFEYFVNQVKSGRYTSAEGVVWFCFIHFIDPRCLSLFRF